MTEQENDIQRCTYKKADVTDKFNYAYQTLIDVLSKKIDIKLTQTGQDDQDQDLKIASTLMEALKQPKSKENFQKQCEACFDLIFKFFLDLQKESCKMFEIKDVIINLKGTKKERVLVYNGPKFLNRITSSEMVQDQVKKLVLNEIFTKPYFFDNTSFDNIFMLEFTNVFVSKLKQQSSNRKIDVIENIWRIQNGYIYNNQTHKINNITGEPFMEFFRTSFSENCSLLWVTYVDIIPCNDKDLNIDIYKRATSLHLKHSIKLLDIEFSKSNLQNIQQFCYEVLKKINISKQRNFVSFDKHEISSDGHSKKSLPMFKNIMHKFDAKNKQVKVGSGLRSIAQKVSTINPQLLQPGKDFIRYHATRFSPVLSTKNFNIGNFLIMRQSDFMDELYIDLDIFTQEDKNQLSHLKKDEENASSIAEFYEDYISGKKLTSLLTKLPNFKFKLTEEQVNLIGDSSDTITIGRSGTGKTTCSILRLVSTELLYKIKHCSDSKIKFGSKAMATSYGFRSMFMTASSVLADDVKQYYTKLTDQIKDKLHQKEQAASNQFNDNSDLETHGLEQSIEGIELDLDIDLENDFDLNTEEGKSYKNKNTNMLGYKDEEFPMFVTIRKFLYQLDSTLKVSFFYRDYRNEITTNNLGFFNDSGGDQYETAAEKFYTNPIVGAYFDPEECVFQSLNEANQEEDSEEEDNGVDNAKIKTKMPDNKKKDKKMNRVLSSEVSFSTFKNQFYAFRRKYEKSEKSERNVNAAVLWSEIMCEIKGSPKSHLYKGELPMYEYIINGYSRKFSKPALEYIYSIYLEYEQWKSEKNYYDMMDLVMFIIRQIRIFGYRGPKIHFMMVDEIQDLTFSMIYLINLISDKVFFFTGDNAQNIAKGINYKFQDMVKLFDKTNLDDKVFHDIDKNGVNLHHLSYNFRSHQRILNLANNVICCLELGFPNSIDHLSKENSDVDGPKPVVFEIGTSQANVMEFFAHVLCSSQNYDDEKINLGYNQVIIVRNDNAKREIPAALSNALCLTVYEAKGMEFDDVVLWNFFSNSMSSQNWMTLISAITVSEETQIETEVFERNLHKKNQIVLHKIPKENESEDLYYKVLSLNYNQDSKVLSEAHMSSFDELCSELKLLYVALTRAKKRLFIFDENIEQTKENRKLGHPRQHMDKFWKTLGLINTFPKDRLAEINKNLKEGNDFSKIKGFGTRLFEIINKLKSFVGQTDKKEWKKLGIKFFKRSQFAQALRCFINSGDEKLKLRTEASKLAIKAGEKMKILNDKETLNEHTVNLDSMKKGSFIKNLETEVKEDYLNAGHTFVKLDMLKEAASCFYSIKDFEKAVKIFILLRDTNSAAECYFNLERYDKAIQMFEKSNDPWRIVDCYDRMGDYDKIIEMMSVEQKQLTNVERERFQKKYLKKVLERLTYDMERSFKGNNDKDEIQPKKMESDSQKSPAKSAKIDDFLLNDIENNENLFETDLKRVRLNSTYSTTSTNSDFNEAWGIKPKKESKDLDNFAEEITDNVDQLTESFVEIDVKRKQSDSFSSFNMRSSPQLEKNKLPEKFEDIAEQESKEQKNLVKFEVLGFTKKIYLDIVEDSILAKLLKYFCYINDELKQLVIQFLAFSESEFIVYGDMKTADLANIINKCKFEIFVDNMVKAMPNVVTLQLDCLDDFNMFVLAIQISNRFSLPEQSARFTVSLLSKYSNITNKNMVGNYFKLYDSVFKKENQINRIVSASAFHSVLQKVDSSLQHRPNFLGQRPNTYTPLSIAKFVTQGYWRQCPTILPLEEAMNLQKFFNNLDVAVILWANCITDYDRRNKILKKFKSIKIRSEKIAYIYNDIKLKELKEISLQTFIQEILWSRNIDSIMRFVNPLPCMSENQSTFVEFEDLPLFSNLLKALLDLSNIEGFEFDDDQKFCTFWNFIYKESYHVMTSGKFSQQNDFLSFYDLGICLGLCMSQYLKQPTINLPEENLKGDKKPYLLTAILKKNITFIHKNLIIQKNLSACVKKLKTILSSTSNFLSLWKFLKGFLIIYLVKPTNWYAESQSWYQSSNMLIHRNSILVQQILKKSQQLYIIDCGYDHVMAKFDIIMNHITKPLQNALEKQQLTYDNLNYNTSYLTSIDYINIFDAIGYQVKSRNRVRKKDYAADQKKRELLSEKDKLENLLKDFESLRKDSIDNIDPDNKEISHHKLVELQNAIKKIEKELCEIDPSYSPLRQFQKKIVKIINRKMNDDMEFSVNPKVVYSKPIDGLEFSKNFNIDVLKNYDWEKHTNEDNFDILNKQNFGVFWMEKAFRKWRIIGFRQNNIQDFNNILKMFNYCKIANNESFWNYFIYKRLKVSNYHLKDQILSLLDIEHSLKSGCIDEFIEISLFLFNSCYNLMPRSFKLGLLKRCLIVFLLSIASNEKGQELWLTKDLCNYVTKNLPIFDSTEMIGDYDEYENQDFVTSFKKVTSVRKIEQKDEEEKLLKLKGFNLAGCSLEWFDEQLKALTQVITKEWNALFDNYEGFQNELILVLSKNMHLYQDYEDDVLNLVCDFEDYVDTKCIKVEESNFWQTKFENRVSDKNECLIKYDKLCLKSQVKLSSYIYTFSVIRKSTQLKNWKEKGYIIRNFQKNQNLVYEFGKIGNIKVENCYKFGLIYEVFEYAQKVMDELYFCYYRKPRIKAIDFHYLWDLFERIRNVKHKLVDKVKLLNQAQTSDQKAINVEYLYSIFSQIANGDKKQTAAEKFKEYSELKGTITPQSNKITNSRKGSENLEDDDPFYLEKFTKTEKESQREILNEIILWKTSNIQFEEADQILEDEFLEKQKLIKEKLKLGIRK